MTTAEDYGEMTSELERRDNTPTQEHAKDTFAFVSPSPILSNHTLTPVIYMKDEEESHSLLIENRRAMVAAFSTFDCPL